jgi:bifunctional enzyme CysN/CysC
MVQSRALTVWITGFPGAGKTTAGSGLVAALASRGVASRLVDGDDLRAATSADLGFARMDRAENVRRAGEMALSLTLEGVVAVVTLVSPFSSDRMAVRSNHERHGVPFLEVWVSTPLHICEARDPKGLYRRARQGLLRDMTGVDQPYEAPTAPDIEVSTATLGVDDVTQRLLVPTMALLAQDAPLGDADRWAREHGPGAG